MADSQVKIDIETKGSRAAISAAQKTGAAVGKANQTAGQTAKASAQAQQQAAKATSGAMKQMMGMAMQYIGVMVLMKEAMAGVKEGMISEIALARLKTGLENIGFAGGVAYKALVDFAQELHNVYGIADSLAVPALERLTRATGDVKDAMYLSQLAARMSIQLEGVDYPAAVNMLVEAESGKGMTLVAAAAKMGVLIKKTADVQTAYQQLEGALGKSSAVMDTNADRARRISNEFGELKKQLFQGLMPAINFATGVFTELALVIKTTGSNLGLMLDLAKQIVPQLMVIMNPVNWIQPQKMMEAYNLMEVYTKTYFRNMAESNEKFVAEWNRINALAQGVPANLGAVLELDPEHGVGVPVLPKTGGAAGGGAGGGAGEAAAKAQFDRMAMLRRQYASGDLQAAMDHQLSLREIETFGMADRIAMWEQESEARGAALEKQLALQARFGEAAGQMMGNSINGMTNLWGGYFEKIAAGEQVKTNMFAASGKLLLAMLLDQVREHLQTEAVKHATLAGALWAGSIFNPLLIPAALGETAVAAALGVGAVAAGTGAGMLTPKGAETVMPVEEVNPGGGYGGGGISGGGSGARGGETISNSNVTIYYNPTMVVNGNVYGMDDFRELVMQFFRDYSYIRGTDLAPIGG